MGGRTESFSQVYDVKEGFKIKYFGVNGLYAYILYKSKLAYAIENIYYVYGFCPFN